MRTKTLLLTAALSAAGALTSMAQVYSVNIVGYVNLSIPPGFSMVANQLDNAPDNKISTLFPAPPPGTIFYKFDNNLNTYLNDTFPLSGGWPAGGSSLSLNPGEGAFVFNTAASAFTATFVGQVRTGTTTVSVPPGFSIVSSIIPQAGFLYDPITANNDLGYALPETEEIVYQFNNTLNTYGNGTWKGTFWNGGNANSGHGPTLAVGESFFNYTPTANTHVWTRTFNVGP